MEEVEIIAPCAINAEGVKVTVRPDIFSVKGMADALRQAESDVVALSPCVRPFSALAGSVSFMVDCLEGQEAVMVYADYVIDDGGAKELRRLNDTETHVVRDSFDFGPLLRIEDLVLSLQDARRVADALGTPLAYRPQDQDPLDVERVQLVGVSQGLEQLVQAPRQPPGIAHGIDELDALQLLFVAQHQLASFSQQTCRAAP